MNKRFISLHIDAEKGEGPDLAKRFGIRSYPTLIVVNGDDVEVDRMFGFRPPKDFLAKIKPWSEGKSYLDLKTRLEKNPKDFDAALSLAASLDERRQPQDALKLYKEVATSSDAPEGVRKQAKGKQILAEFMLSKEKDIAPVEAFFNGGRDAEGVFDHAWVMYQHYQHAENLDKAELAAEYLLKHGAADNAVFLNSYAWSLAVTYRDVERAISLAKKATALDPENPDLFDTLAEAYWRDEKYDEAIRAETKAVELAKPGRQRASYEKRLKEIRADKAESEEDEDASE